MSVDSNASLPLMDEVASDRNFSSFTSASVEASSDLT